MDKAIEAQADLTSSQNRIYRNGKLEGFAEGEKKGLAKGKKEGLAEGQRNIARNLKALGMPGGQIAQATGLSEPEIGLL
jgi:predicted transposase/invertase (TIGR01784 family)